MAKNLIINLYEGCIASFKLPFKAKELTRALVVNPMAGTVVDEEKNTLFVAKVHEGRTELNNFGVMVNEKDKPYVLVMDKPVSKDKVNETYIKPSIYLPIVAEQIAAALATIDGANITLVDHAAAPKDVPAVETPKAPKTPKATKATAKAK